jgi:AraC-like DNA-binding protein
MVLEPASEAFVGIRLRAGAARSLLELPVGEIRDEAIPLQNLWGKHGRAIEELMCEAASAEDGMRVLEAALVPLRPLSSFQNAIGYLASNGGRVRLEDIARGTGLGIRQFRRRCIEETGLSPRHLARIGRFRNACSHIVQSARVDWADLASEFGYYDQAQLINEFREFSGLAPGAYLRQRGT